MKYLSSEELAIRWKKSEGTLANWRYKNIGPAYSKIGGSVLYELESVEKFEKESIKGI